MPNYTIKVDGLPLPVSAPSRKKAQQAVLKAIKQNPGWLEQQRTLYVETGGNAKNRFLIGAGRELSSVGNAIAATGMDLAFQPGMAEDIRVQEASEAAAFGALDDRNGIGAEDVGQVAPAIATLGMGGVALGMRLTSLIGRMATGLPGKSLKKFVENATKSQLGKSSVGDTVKNLSGKGGKEAVEAVAKAESPAAVDVSISQMSKANQAVREAQVRIQRTLRAQEGQRAPGQLTPEAQAAQQQGAAQAASRATANRQAQEAAAQQAKQAQGAAARSHAADKATLEKAQLRELLRSFNSGRPVQ